MSLVISISKYGKSVGKAYKYKINRNVYVGIILNYSLYGQYCSLFVLTLYLAYSLSTKAKLFPLLTIIMLAMGLTLKPKDFLNVIHNKKAIGVGLILQFSVMPIAALLISLLLGFDPMLTIGMSIGWQRGRWYIIKCDVLSGERGCGFVDYHDINIHLVRCGTDPLLVELLAGKAVDVPVASMLMSLVNCFSTRCWWCCIECFLTFSNRET